MTYHAIRTASGFTQIEYAHYFGIPKRTVENWDEGINAPALYLVALMEYKLRHEGII